MKNYRPYTRRRRLSPLRLLILIIAIILFLLISALAVYGCLAVINGDNQGKTSDISDVDPGGDALEPEDGGNVPDLTPDDASGTDPGKEPVLPSQGEEPTLNGDNSKEVFGEVGVSKAGYDYSKPVPESAAVEDSYFDDVVFIGNSRTEGFMLYAGPSNAKYLTSVGLAVNTAFSKKNITVDGQKVSVMDALATMSFSKVYIMLGMNELGWVYPSVYQEYYGRIIDRIREINPNAVIYIQSILPVTAEKSESSEWENNTRISQYNQLLMELAQEKQVYYVNVAEAIADETGALPADNAFDGIHLKPSACKPWLEYLKTHTVKE